MNAEGVNVAQPQGRLGCQHDARLRTLFGVGGMSGYGGQWPAYMCHPYFTKNFGTAPVENFLPVNNDGEKWNLYGVLRFPRGRREAVCAGDERGGDQRDERQAGQACAERRRFR